MIFFVIFLDKTFIVHQHGIRTKAVVNSRFYLQKHSSLITTNLVFKRQTNFMNSFYRSTRNILHYQFCYILIFFALFSSMHYIYMYIYIYLLIKISLHFITYFLCLFHFIHLLYQISHEFLGYSFLTVILNFFPMFLINFVSFLLLNPLHFFYCIN